METTASPNNVLVKPVKGDAKPKKGRAAELHRRGLISTAQLQKLAAKE